MFLVGVVQWHLCLWGVAGEFRSGAEHFAREGVHQFMPSGRMDGVMCSGCSAVGGISYPSVAQVLPVALIWNSWADWVLNQMGYSHWVGVNGGDVVMRGE